MPKKALLVLVAAMLVSFWLPAASLAASAKEARSLTVSPLKLEFRTLPGESSTQTVRVANSGRGPIYVSSGLLDYYIKPDNRFVFLPPGDKSYSCARWVSLDNKDFSLVPGQVQDVTIRLAVPPAAEIGGHYACVFFQTATDKPTGSGVGIIGRVGTLILATVGDEKDIVRDGQITSFTLTNPWYGRDASGRVVFRNNGNVHLTLKGHATVRDFFGRQVAKLPLQDITILPKTDRYLPVKWAGPLFGRFTAKAAVSYGPDMFTYNIERTSSELTFWIIPWLIIIGVLVALMLGWRLYLGRRRAHAPIATTTPAAGQQPLARSAAHTDHRS